MSQVKKLDGEYHSPGEVATAELMNWTDPLLYKAMCWLTNKKLYDDAADVSDIRPNLPCLNIAANIITLATSVVSPNHLSLAVYLHHDFGSRQLVETMCAMGYCISYTELRRFLTSAAEHVNSTQEPSAVKSYKLPEIMSRQDGGHLILGGADNWDHNERTTDGKQTTHAMTTIFVQRKGESHRSYPRIPRVPAQSLNLDFIQGGDLSKLLLYRKPRLRPEPEFQPPVSVKDIQELRGNAGFKKIVNVETVYNIAWSGHMHSRQEQGIPPWGLFHAALMTDTNSDVSVISFNPIIMANPTDHQTVYTTLMRLKESMNNLGQTNAPIFFDMGLLMKALEITWANPIKLAGVIPCDSGMHLLMSVISAVGHLYSDAGLRELLSESGVFAAGSVQKILTSKDFDRGIYALKLLDEALNAVLIYRLQFHRMVQENRQ